MNEDVVAKRPASNPRLKLARAGFEEGMTVPHMMIGDRSASPCASEEGARSLRADRYAARVRVGAV